MYISSYTLLSIFLMNITLYLLCTIFFHCCQLLQHCKGRKSVGQIKDDPTVTAFVCIVVYIKSDILSHIINVCCV